MTRYVITQVDFDPAGEVRRGEVDQIVGGNYALPQVAGEPRVLDRLAIVDLIGSGDNVYAHRGGLPLDEVRVRVGAHGVEYLDSVRDGEVSDALRALPRLPREE
jgi:hypothetical protein